MLPLRFGTPSKESKLTAKSLAAVALVLSFAACKSNVQTSRDTHSSTSGFDPGIATITHNDEATNSRMAEVKYNRGSLAVGQTISVSSTYQTDPAEVAEDFGIGGAISTTDVAVVVSSNVDQNLDNPMTIALDLPSAGAGLAGLIWDNRIFFVVYTVKDSATGTWSRGIMADSELTVKNNQVLFQSKYWGRYEIFESVQEIKHTRATVAVEQPDFTRPPVAITAISPLIAKVGAKITLTGRYLTSATQVLVGGRSVDANHSRQGVLSFAVPDLAAGLTWIVVKERGSEDSAKFMIEAPSANGPVIDAKPASVCAGINYIDGTGKAQVGAKGCGPSSCTAEGQTGCVASTEFPAVAKADVPYSKLTEKLSIFGQQGAVNIPAGMRPCTSAGQVGCLVTANFVSLKKGQITAKMLRKGLVIPKELTGTGAHIFGTYPSATNPLRAPAAGWNPLKANNFSAALAAAANTKYSYWDSTGKEHSFSAEGSLVPTAIAAGVTIHGVKGETPVSFQPFCNASTTTGCYVKAPYAAVAGSILTPANIRYGAKVGGITGSYPSVNAPLAPAGPEPDLTNGNFNQAMVAAKSYVFYNSKGERLTTTPQPQLSPEFINKDYPIFGVSGQVGKVDKNVYKPYHIREGARLGDVVGTMRMGCRNQADRTKYNYDKDFGTGDLDPYDSTQDGVFPKENPWQGKNEYVCNDGAWEDLTVNGCQVASSTCIFRNRHTRQLWAGFSTQLRTFYQSHTFCTNLTIAGKKNWNTPSIHELMRAYSYGINYLPAGNPTFVKNGLYWSNTNKYGLTQGVYEPNTIPKRRMQLKVGSMDSALSEKSTAYVLCTKKDTSP